MASFGVFLWDELAGLRCAFLCMVAALAGASW
jgi:hypothetical protein